MNTDAPKEKPLVPPKPDTTPPTKRLIPDRPTPNMPDDVSGDDCVISALDGAWRWLCGK